MHDQFQRAVIDNRHLLPDPPGSPEDTATRALVALPLWALRLWCSFKLTMGSFGSSP